MPKHTKSKVSATYDVHRAASAGQDADYTYMIETITALQLKQNSEHVNWDDLGRTFKEQERRVYSRREGLKGYLKRAEAANIVQLHESPGEKGSVTLVPESTTNEVKRRSKSSTPRAVKSSGRHTKAKVKGSSSKSLQRTADADFASLMSAITKYPLVQGGAEMLAGAAFALAKYKPSNFKGVEGVDVKGITGS